MASGHHSTLKKEEEKKAPLPRHHPHSNSHSPPHDATPSKESSGSTMATMLQHGTTEEAFTRAAACCSPRRPQKQHNCPRPKPHTHSTTALSPAHSHTNYPDTSALRCRSWIHARGVQGGGGMGGVHADRSSRKRLCGDRQQRHMVAWPTPALTTAHLLLCN